MVLKTLSLALALGALATNIHAQELRLHDSMVIGEDPESCGDLFNSFVGGMNNRCEGTGAEDALTVGNGNSIDSGSVIIGSANKSIGPDPATGGSSIQVGRGNTSEGLLNTQLGHFNEISGDSNQSVGMGNAVHGNFNSALGDRIRVEGSYNQVFGDSASAEGQQQVVMGYFAKGRADYCVAIGSGSECDESDEFSVGYESWQRRVSNVKDGRDLTDAANVGQVVPLAQSLGGGASYQNGQFIKPTFELSTGTYDNVDAALKGLDGKLGAGGADGASAYEVALRNGFRGTEQQWLESLRGADGRDGDGGSQVSAGRNVEVEDNNDGTRSVHLSDQIELTERGSVAVGGTTMDALGVRIDAGPSMTRDGLDAGNQRITGVADGRVARGSLDAVNGGQLWDMERRFDDRWSNVDNRMRGLDRRLSGVCAMGQAQSQVALSAASINKRNRFAMGMGYCGKTAVSMGYVRDLTTPRGSPSAFSFGASTTGDDTSIGVGWAIGW